MLVSLMVLTTLVFGGSIKATAMPMDPTDETKVPHYFGPYPNWANSPFTLPDAIVTISPPSVGGTQAYATASVGANGVITGITITDAGSGYSNAQVTITNSDGTNNTSAKADGTIVKKGAVVAVTVDQPGSGYTAPTVTFSGNGGAAATAYGGVDQVIITFAGSGYSMPTVEFDLPDGPGGLQAQGHAVCVGDPVGGPYCAPVKPGDTVVIESIVVDNPGSGYSFAPGVAIHNGTLYDPIAGATLATATTSLSITAIVKGCERNTWT